jgi:uncharacterized phage protein gp47/JayE
MSSFGVLPDGFSQKELSDIRDEVNDDLVAGFGPETNILDDSVIGNFVGTITDKLAEAWEVLAAVYRSQFPSSASDEALDEVASITGVTREAARGSTVVLDQIFLDGGVTLPAGRIVSVGEAGNRFVTDADVTNPLGDPNTVSVPATSELTGPITGFANTINNIITPFTGWNAKAALTNGVADTYALSDGQTLTIKIDGGAVQTATFNTGDFVDIANATAAEVAAVIDTDITGGTAGTVSSGGSTFVRASSETDGPGSSIEITGGTANAALSFSTTEIKGFNTEDVGLGRDIETDAALRNRREDLLRVTGKASLEAVRAKVLEILGVDEAFIFQNTTLITDPSGVPGKAFETVIERDALLATDAIVAAVIFDNQPVGIEAFGTINEIVTDSQGFGQAVGFSDATEVDIFIDITVVTNTDPKLGPIYPVDGDAQVAAALALEGNTLGIGRDVIAAAIKCEAFNVSGVVDISVFEIDDAPSPTVEANVPIAIREIAKFDTGDIAVTSV